MFVGILKLDLFLPALNSLKTKRQILQSIKSQLRNNFNVSVSEVDDNDLWQRASIGISCVANSKKLCLEQLQLIFEFVAKFKEVEIINKEQQIV